MTDPVILRQRLTEAESALHQLTTGARVVSIRDASGRQVNYTAATQGDLRAYITDLRGQLGQGGRAPAKRVYFG